MYSQIVLSQNVRNALESLDVPIRVLRGNADTLNPPASWRGAAGANHTTLADCQERGLTIVSWAAPNADGLEYIQNSPGFLYKDGCQRVTSYGDDWVVPGNLSAGEEVFTETIDTLEPTHRPYAVAGYKTIWLLFRLESLQEQDMLNVDKLILEPAKMALANGERMAAMAAHQAAQATEAAKRDFLQVVNRRNEHRRTPEQAEEEGNRFRAQILSYQGQIATSLARMREKFREAEMLKNNPPEEPDWSDTWDRLLEHPKVVRVESRRRRIDIYTTELPIYDEENHQHRYLGKFKIEIPLEDPEQGYLPKLRNLDNQHDYFDHPHVEDGIPCYGGSAELVSEFMYNGEMLGLLEFLFQYLESYNPHDSMGSNIDYWKDDPWPRTNVVVEETTDVKHQEIIYADDSPCQCQDCRQARGE